MITAGIDIGIENIKAVILKDNQVIARGTAISGGAGRGSAAGEVWKEILNKAGINAEEVVKITATGQGKYDVKFASGNIVEPVADALAAHFLYPAAKTVVDIGADQVRVVTFDTAGKIEEVVLNQKCAAGIGIFLKSIARRLGMSLEEMSHLSGAASTRLTVNDCCAVFAELDAIALNIENTPRADIVQAVYEALAARINGVLNDKIIPAKNTTVLIGGVARNQSLINALKKRSGIDFLIPAYPEYGCALGAALNGI